MPYRCLTKCLRGAWCLEDASDVRICLGLLPMVFLFVKWSLLGHFRSPAGLGVFGAAEELVGSFSPCSEWFVLRSSSLFLVGALQQMSEPCIDARSYLAVFVLVLNVLCSVLFLILRRSSGADVRSYRADGGASWLILCRVLNGLCFGPIPYSSQELWSRCRSHALVRGVSWQVLSLF